MRSPPNHRDRPLTSTRAGLLIPAICLSLSACARERQVTPPAGLPLDASSNAPAGTTAPPSVAAPPTVAIPGPTAALPPPDDRPAYVRFGDEVDALYQRYTERLKKAHGRLKAATEAEAPDLAAKLSPTPPAPVEYGYGILPAVTPGAEPGGPERAESRVYSWPWTRTLVERESGRVEAMEKQLDEAAALPPAERRARYEKLVNDYPDIEFWQKNIGGHIEYNRFWQKEIAGDKARYDFFTRMHDAVVERQRALDELAKKEDPALRAREKELGKTVHDAAYDAASPPLYIQVQHPRPGVTVLRVPVYTDITDDAFTAAIERAIERVWHVKTEKEELRVEVAITRIAPSKLYPAGDLPAKGAHIDVAAHVARFPPNGAVLTTGANSLHAVPGRYVAMGPLSVSENVLAHEFGHVLGFVDVYFRGYHARADGQGYDVMEICPDPADIMSHPGKGGVLRDHFDILLRALAAKKK